MEERCEVLIPLGQVNSFHYASVSPRACWLKEDPEWHKVWLLEAHQVHKGDEGIIPGVGLPRIIRRAVWKYSPGDGRPAPLL